MREDGRKRAGKAGFVLLLLSALALIGFLLAASGTFDFSAWFAKTANVDENGYYSEYDARIGLELSTTAVPGRPTQTSAAVADMDADMHRPARPATPAKP